MVEIAIIAAVLLVLALISISDSKLDDQRNR